MVQSKNVSYINSCFFLGNLHGKNLFLKNYGIVRKLRI